MSSVSLLYKELRHEQGSKEWHQARCGFLTASRASILMDGSAKAKNKLLQELIAQEMAGEVVEKKAFSLAMEWGRRNEERARAVYNLNFPRVDSCGFFVCMPFPFIGGSPDGVARSGDSGLVSSGLEIKCPYNPEIHERHRAGEINPAYYWQIQFSMWLLNVPYWDFMSFDPRREASAQCHFRRFERDFSIMCRISEEVGNWSTHRARGTFYAEAMTPVELMAAGLLPKFF